MAHRKLPVFDEKGFVILRDYDGPAIPTEEWMGLEYMDWKSGGDTNFAPLASALGEMECAGFWDHGKPDKDGIWTKNEEIAPVAGALRRGGRLALRPRARHQAQPQRRGVRAFASCTSTTTTGSIPRARAGWCAPGWS